MPKRNPKVICNWKNTHWMQYFHENRNLWSPVASEWKRLEEEYKKLHESI